MEESRKDRPLFYFIILFIIYSSGSYSVSHRIIPYNVVFIVRLIVLLYVGMRFNGKLRLSQDRFLWFLLPSILMLISAAFNFENISNELTVIFVFFVVVLMTGMIDFNDFKSIYSNIMMVVTAVSLALFFLYLIFPQLNNVLVSTDLDGHTSSNLFIFNKFTNLNRNCAFFWEPGAFQTYVAFAMIFELSAKKMNFKKLAVFSLGIFSTFSTTGYMVLALIWLLIFFSKSKAKTNVRISVIVLALIALLYIYYNQDYFFSSRYTSTTFGKVFQFLENRNDANLFTSASVRVYSVTKPFGLFFQKPIFGWGYDGLKDVMFPYTRGMNTCTYVNWFATYGLLFGIVMVRGFIGIVKSLKVSMIGGLLVFVILFFATGSENYVRSTFILLLSLFGNCYIPVLARNNSSIKTVEFDR